MSAVTETAISDAIVGPPMIGIFRVMIATIKGKNLEYRKATKKKVLRSRARLNMGRIGEYTGKGRNDDGKERA